MEPRVVGNLIEDNSEQPRFAGTNFASDSHEFAWFYAEVYIVESRCRELISFPVAVEISENNFSFANFLIRFLFIYIIFNLIFDKVL